MHRLTRLFAPARRAWRRALRRHGSEHGVVGALVAVMTSTGVLMGMGALVIDLGRLSLEKQELQTGADAASWAIALNCVAVKITCEMAPQTTVAQKYATANVKDKTADAQICIQGKTCPAFSSTVGCPTTTVTGGTSVEVRTSTRTGNSTLLPTTFANFFTGDNTAGSRVGACARVAWGQPVTGKVLALGISECDWKRVTNNNTTYFGPLANALGELGLHSVLGLNPPTATDEGMIQMTSGATALGLPLPFCAGDATSPRGWTWLLTPSGLGPDAQCELELDVGDLPRSSFLVNTLSNLLGTACKTRLAKIISDRRPVLVPIFDKSLGLLSLAPQHRIVGFAPFVFTGHANLLGGLIGGVTSLLQGGGLPATIFQTTCGATNCIAGYFTRTLMPVDKPVFGTGTDYGATVIGRTG